MGRRYKRKRKSYHYHSNRCSYCGEDISGIPHGCRFCRKRHCDLHILPEDHKCGNLRTTTHWGTKNSKYKGGHFRSNNHRSKDRSHQRFKLPRIRINKFFKALILAIVTFFLAYKYPGYALLLWVEAGAWAYLSYVLFRRVFRWANRVSMADDLAFFGLRILGGVVTLVGGYFLFATVLASVLVRDSAPQSIPLFAIIAGLMLLGLFIAFKTNRRHHVVGVWRA